ncbi:MAG: oligosaccharide flippase family protein [Candidatus Micrarchaeaceae archaeon]
MEQIELKEEIGGGIFLQYVRSISTVLAGFIFYIYIIHFYSSELVGTVALLLAIANLLSTFFPLGLGYGLRHFLSYHLGRKEYSSMKGMIVKFSAIGLALSALSFIFLYFSAPIFAFLFFHSLKYTVLVKFLGIDLFFIIIGTFLSDVLIGIQNFKSQAEWNIVCTIVTYVLPIILFIHFNSTIFIVLGLASGYALSSVAYSILVFRRIGKMRTEGERVSVSPILKYAFPIFLASLIGYGASYVDRFVVSYLLNLSLLGVYNFALLISSAISFIVSPFATILLPKLSEMYGTGRREEMNNFVAKGMELMSTIYVPIAMLVAALSSYILLFLSNGSYLPASVPVTIVLVVSSAFVTGNILAVSLQSVRKTKIFIISSSFALLSNFVISILLIPRFQLVGAAIGYSSISAVSFFIMYYYAKKFGILKFEGIKIGKIYISAAVMFIVVFTLERMLPYSPLKLLLLIVLGFAIYSGMIKVLKTFNKNDLDFVILLMPWFLQRSKRLISLLFL